MAIELTTPNSVAALIEALQQFPADAEVWSGDGTAWPVTHIEVDDIGGRRVVQLS